jgi:L-Lysine epsilon oxidase N-terminal/L-lysine epsilon oxidase C-terminal domain
MGRFKAARGSDSRIVRAAIHPAIGVARVGNSMRGFFIGPEVTDPEPVKPGFVKDSNGALKRQAARFRIYGYNALGEAVAELTAQNAEIEWKVQVANRKAAWYQFQIALDIPEASSAPASNLRNAQEADRSKLAITPEARSISGVKKSGRKYWFDDGCFLGIPVYLGELRSDEEGRLLFLGGRGVSASATGQPAMDFANNDGWHDDVSDGPVTAEVRVGGQGIPVEPAWVIVGPPDYAPDVLGVRTMFDLLSDVYVQGGWLEVPSRVSFTRDVLPILGRLTRLQWVNAGFAAQFGWRGPNDFLTPEYLSRLSSAGPDHAELRRQIYSVFRDFGRDGMSPAPWPWIYGDAMSIPAVSVRQYSALTATQMLVLSKWADGTFDADFDPKAAHARNLERIPLQEQPAMLDRAALTFCLADAFHPGCEMTWPVRHCSMYAAPFRIRHRGALDEEPSLRRVLTPEAALAVGGPLYAQGPGGLTRWMAVPWQTDTASCRAGYDKQYDVHLPTFWPARVPNDVLTLEDYLTVIDSTKPPDVREAAFQRRAVWLRGLGPTDTLAEYYKAINNMVADFGKLGVVESRPGVEGEDRFPPEMLVESQPELPVVAHAQGLLMPHAGGAGDERRPGGAAPEAADAERGLVNKVRRFPRGLRPRGAG